VFHHPNVWPSPPKTILHTPFTRFDLTSSSTPSNKFDSLPSEISFAILQYLTPSSLIALSTTCKSLRTILTDPAIMVHIFKEMIFKTDYLTWILPVKRQGRETEISIYVARLWLGYASIGPGLSLAELFESGFLNADELPFSSPSFPYFAYVRVCFESDSVRNRRRIWGITKQFETIWREYRTNGWERNVL